MLPPMFLMLGRINNQICRGKNAAVHYPVRVRAGYGSVALFAQKVAVAGVVSTCTDRIVTTVS